MRSNEVHKKYREFTSLLLFHFIGTEHTIEFVYSDCELLAGTLIQAKFCWYFLSLF